MPRLIAFAGLCAIAAINGRTGAYAANVQNSGLLAAIYSLAEVGAVVWFAIFAAWSIAQWDTAEEAYRTGDGAVLVLLGLAILLPLPTAASLAGMGAALWLFFTSAKASVGRRLAIVLIAIAAQQIVGRIFLALFSEPVLAADVELATLLSGLGAEGNVIIRDDGTQLIVAAGCSSVRNLSVAALGWIAAIQLFNVPICARLWAYFLASIIIIVLLNTLRMLSMAWFPLHFDFLHHGGGVMLFGWSGFIVMMLIIGIAVLDLAPRKTMA
jgi:exosortase/archaeosortase family protein